jgi:hypothetical protein
MSTQSANQSAKPLAASHIKAGLRKKSFQISHQDFSAHIKKKNTAF